jgi:hypothetical protein
MKYTETFHVFVVTKISKTATAVDVSTMINRLAILFEVLSLTIPTTCPPHTSANPSTRKTKRAVTKSLEVHLLLLWTGLCRKVIDKIQQHILTGAQENARPQKRIHSGLKIIGHLLPS